MVIIWLMMVNIYIYIYLVGGWFLPLWKMMEWVIMILPNWMESHKIPWFQTTNQNLTSEKSMVCLSVIAKIHIFSQWFLMISPFLAATSWQFPRHSPAWSARYRCERRGTMWNRCLSHKEQFLQYFFWPEIPEKWISVTTYNPIFNAHDKPMYNLYNWNTGHRCQWITIKNIFLVRKKNGYDMKIPGKARWLCDTEPKMSFYSTETGFWTDFPAHGLRKFSTQYIE